MVNSVDCDVSFDFALLFSLFILFMLFWVYLVLFGCLLGCTACFSDYCCLFRLVACCLLFVCGL